MCDFEELEGLGELEGGKARLAQSQVQDAQIVEVELWVKLATLLIHGISARLLILIACAVARLVEAGLRIAAIAYSLSVLIILEE